MIVCCQYDAKITGYQYKYVDITLSAGMMSVCLSRETNNLVEISASCLCGAVADLENGFIEKSCKGTIKIQK